jgi:uncharacterized membrane protein
MLMSGILHLTSPDAHKTLKFPSQPFLSEGLRLSGIDELERGYALVAFRVNDAAVAARGAALGHSSSKSPQKSLVATRGHPVPDRA